MNLRAGAAGSRSIPGLWGGLVLALLVAGYCWTPRPACGQSSNITTTTSTTHHTTFVNIGACNGVVNGSIAGTNTSLSVTLAFGPTTIFIGPDQSVPFTVAAGTENVNTNTHTETFVNLCDQPAAGIPVLSPVGLLGLGAGLAGLALRRLRRTRAGPARDGPPDRG